MTAKFVPKTYEFEATFIYLFILFYFILFYFILFYLLINSFIY